MRFFITLAALYAAFVIAAPLPQTDPNPDLLGGLTSTLSGLTGSITTSIIDSLGVSQLGGASDTVSPFKQKVDETVAGTHLTTALDGRQVGEVTIVDEVVGPLVDGGELLRRQLDDPDALIGGISIVAPALDHDINLGTARRRRQGSVVQQDVDAPLGAALPTPAAPGPASSGDLALREPTGLDVETLANDIVDLVKSIILNGTIPDLGTLISNITTLIQEIGLTPTGSTARARDLDLRQLNNVESEAVPAQSDGVDAPADGLVLRQSGGLITSLDALIGSILGGGIVRRQSPEPLTENPPDYWSQIQSWWQESVGNFANGGSD